MATNYRKGYELEHRTKQFLEKNGWLAMRSPASKTPIDLMATKEGDSLIIQCKKTTKSENMYITGLDPLLELGKKHKTIPLLVYSFHRSPLYVKEVKKPKITVHRLEKHLELEKYLKIKEIRDYDNMIIG